MKLVLFNFSPEMVHIIQKHTSTIIEEYEVLNLTNNEASIKEAIIARDNNIGIVFLDKESFHYDLLYSFIDYSDLLFIIDAKDFTEEESVLLDDCTMDMSDNLDISIIDAGDDLVKCTIESIRRYIVNIISFGSDE